MRPLTLRATYALSDCGRSCAVSQELSDEISEALERARVVGVLDAWAVYRGPAGRGGQWYVVQDTVCALHVLPPGANLELPVRYFDGETADAARAAAAKAIEAGEVGQ